MNKYTFYLLTFLCVSTSSFSHSMNHEISADVSPANYTASLKEVMETSNEAAVKTPNIVEENVNNVVNREAIIGNYGIDSEIKKKNTDNERKASGIMQLLQVILKEPIRIIQFGIKTQRLKNDNVIPKGFVVSTISRFIGSMIYDSCLVTCIVNQCMDEKFLEGKSSWIWLGLLLSGESLNYVGRTIVRTMYQETSKLYGPSDDKTEESGS